MCILMPFLGTWISLLFRALAPRKRSPVAGWKFLTIRKDNFV